MADIAGLAEAGNFVEVVGEAELAETAVAGKVVEAEVKGLLDRLTRPQKLGQRYQLAP